VRQPKGIPRQAGKRRITYKRAPEQREGHFNPTTATAHQHLAPGDSTTSDVFKTAPGRTGAIPRLRPFLPACYCSAYGSHKHSLHTTKSGRHQTPSFVVSVQQRVSTISLQLGLCTKSDPSDPPPDEQRREGPICRPHRRRRPHRARGSRHQIHSSELCASGIAFLYRAGRADTESKRARQHQEQHQTD
jgi:hypothetical protein